MKPQDMLTLGLVLSRAGLPSSYQDKALRTGLSLGEAHASLKRLVQSGLLDAESKRVLPMAVGEFLTHGLRYVFPPRFGGRARGLGTAGAAEPLARRFAANGLDWVWPWEEGLVEGWALEPLYASVPRACASDPELYEWMALFDALRAGQARERRFAGEEVEARLGLRAAV